MNLVTTAKEKLEALEFDAAKKLYEEALKQDTRNAFLHQQLARCLWKLDDFEGARQEATYALQLDSNLVLPHVTLAYLYLKNGEDKKAFHEVEQALRKNSNVKEIHYFLGYYYLNAGDTYKAKQSFQKAIDIDATSPAEYYGLGGVFAQERNLKETRHNYKRAAQLGDKRAAQLVSLTYLQQLRILLGATIAMCFLAMLIFPSFLYSTIFLLAGLLLQGIPAFFVSRQGVSTSPSEGRKFLIVAVIFLVGYFATRLWCAPLKLDT